MSGPRQIAVVGAGPSGLFSAQALLKAVPGAVIDVIEKLPVPHGLIRYGVAPDHQGTKAVTRQFERLFERDGVAFHGNVEIGREVSLSALLGLYDAVVLAAGLSVDRRLGVPGETLAGVITSGALTRWINSHPSEGATPPALGRNVVVVGAGNVALDIARLLAKTPDEFSGSDFDPTRAAALDACGIETIDVVGRGSASACRFDPALIKEMAHLACARVEVHGDLDADAPAEAAARLTALKVIHGAGPADARRVVRFRFGCTPEEIIGDAAGAVEAVRFRSADGAILSLPASSIVTAIGFGCESRARLIDAASLPAGDGAGALPHRIGERLFAVGWFRGGAVGTIPEARRDAKLLADAVAAAPATAEPMPAARAGRAGLLARIAAAGVTPVSYAHWKHIEAAETAAAPPGRARLKLCSTSDMIVHVHRAA
ncbi:FAD-dependent oxidoreductase [Rhodoplanes azumiensis]|uniref:FAD-dependent oxidoreductase n=1 Tax=Rhodoplanes azumiensis TaxID=1897628 RepID=A0ABW5AM31_9BRAD